MASYAHNNGKVFIGDPHGVSADAVYRRTQNMLSSAVRYGTTRHIAPHKDQNIVWGKDDKRNFNALIDKSIQDIIGGIKELESVRYDFDQRAFVDTSSENTLGKADFERIARSPAGRAARAGSSTLKRAVLLNTLVQKSSSDVSWGQLLGALERELSLSLSSGALTGTFYSKRAGVTRPTVARHGVKTLKNG